jgi:MFS family permease
VAVHTRSVDEEGLDQGYRRDGLTWASFSGLLGFGFLLAALGPALPYIRAVEHISYIVGALHQAAYAIGGGLAGLLAARAEAHFGRAATICLGLGAAALAAIGLAYGDSLGVTLTASFLISIFGTSALVRIWAVLADAHGARRAVAMTEGEVSVSLGGIVMSLLVGVLAETTLSWRFAFLVGAVVTAAGVIALARSHIPKPAAPPIPRLPSPESDSGLLSSEPTLVIVFAIVALEFSVSFWLASYLNGNIGLSRALAAALVSVLYAANLAGRLLASRMARTITAERVLGGSLLVALAGLPILLVADTAAVAIVGITLTGIGVGAMFPLTSSLHVGASSRTSDSAIGQVLGIASIGQILGPLMVGAVAQAAGLRSGLLLVPFFVLLAGVGLARYRTHDGISR